MTELYINAFDRRNGRVVDLPLSRLCNNCCPEQVAQINPALVGYFAPVVPLIPNAPIAAPRRIGAPRLVGQATVAAQPLDIVSSYQTPPGAFNVQGADVAFNYTGIYNVRVAGTITGTPGVSSSVVITPVPTGNTTIVGPPTTVAITNPVGVAFFDYPFLVDVPTQGSDLFFTASTPNSNVSILNGTINIVRVSSA